jgi:hypothetical protein
MQPFYAKGGFKFSHRDLRMESVAQVEIPNFHVTKINPEEFNLLNNFDRNYFGFERERFLKDWLFMPDSQSLKYTEGTVIKGYGTVRKCRKGYKVGPLFAQNFEVAHEIYKGLATVAQGNQIYIDVPEINKDGMKLAALYDMKEMFGCARMYYGKAPELPYDKIYSVTTFELG